MPDDRLFTPAMLPDLDPSNDTLWTLTYVSRAARPMLRLDLLFLLHQARAANEQAGITGLLLYRDIGFMQLVEGPQHALVGLYQKLLLDRRHQDLVLLDSAPLAQRQFGSWAMGLGDLQNQGWQQVPGYDPFLEGDFDTAAYRANPTRARKLLLAFREQML